ncbi:MAG TPA: linear amide C-N hydrolase, partial [Chitinophagaceae bacterium]
MKKLVAFVFLSAYSLSSFACTTFFLNKDGQLLFGRNYDWVTESGMVMVNARGMVKYGAKPNAANFNWVSNYGSVTFNQYGKEFPTGGMNEKGLVVELMWLDETEYPVRDKRHSLGVLQWIQYQLDCSQSVSEVI